MAQKCHKPHYFLDSSCHLFSKRSHVIFLFSLHFRQFPQLFLNISQVIFQTVFTTFWRVRLSTLPQFGHHFFGQHPFLDSSRHVLGSSCIIFQTILTTFQTVLITFQTALSIFKIVPIIFQTAPMQSFQTVLTSFQTVLTIF